MSTEDRVEGIRKSVGSGGVWLITAGSISKMVSDLRYLLGQLDEERAELKKAYAQNDHLNTVINLQASSSTGVLRGELAEMRVGLARVGHELIDAKADTNKAIRQLDEVRHERDEEQAIAMSACEDMEVAIKELNEEEKTCAELRESLSSEIVSVDSLRAELTQEREARNKVQDEYAHLMVSFLEEQERTRQEKLTVDAIQQTLHGEQYTHRGCRKKLAGVQNQLANEKAESGRLRVLLTERGEEKWAAVSARNEGRETITALRSELADTKARLKEKVSRAKLQKVVMHISNDAMHASGHMILVDPETGRLEVCAKPGATQNARLEALGKRMAQMESDHGLNRGVDGASPPTSATAVEEQHLAGHRRVEARSAVIEAARLVSASCYGPESGSLTGALKSSLETLDALTGEGER